MAQNISNYISKEYLFNLEVGAPTGNFVVGEIVMNGANLGASTATGVLKAIKSSGATTVLVLDSLSGTALFADGETATGNTSGATALVDTIVAVNGSDIQFTTKGIERVKAVGSRVVSEVLVALKDFSNRFEALKDFDTAPTFSGAVTYSGTAAVVTGDIITLTLTATDDVVVSGVPVVSLSVNGVARSLAYDAGTSTSTSLKFKYTAVAGDVATAGQVVVGTVVTGGNVAQSSTQGGTVYSQSVGVSFSAVDTSATTIN